MPSEVRSQSVSPSGAWEIRVAMREIFNSHWLEVPTLLLRADGSVVWTVVDDRWSLDWAEWSGDEVTLTLRKYPGNHLPVDLKPVIDCIARTARLGDTTMPLEALEPTLEKALTWRFAEPDAPKPANDPLSRLKRFFLGS
jgi:hypothetical protein